MRHVTVAALDALTHGYERPGIPQGKCACDGSMVYLTTEAVRVRDNMRATTDRLPSCPHCLVLWDAAIEAGATSQAAPKA